MQRALDKQIGRNGNVCKEERSIIRNAVIYRCFTDYNQSVETRFNLKCHYVSAQSNSTQEAI